MEVDRVDGYGQMAMELDGKNSAESLNTTKNILGLELHLKLDVGPVINSQTLGPSIPIKRGPKLKLWFLESRGLGYGLG